MSGNTEMDGSITVRRSMRRVVSQSLLNQDDDTPKRNREHLSEGSDLTVTPTHLSSSKKVKLENPDEGSNIEEESLLSSKAGPSKAKRRRYSESLHPQRTKHRMRLRHSSGDFPRRRRDKQPRVEFPLRRSTREKRFVFATFNSADMIKQIEGQHDFPVYESEDEMDPYEKLLSPRRMPRRSGCHHRGASEAGDGSKESGAGAGHPTAENEGKKGGDNVKNEEDSDKEVEEEEEEDDEEEEDESDNSEGEGEVGYYLRKRRPVIYQYQPVLQVVEDDTPPKTRRKGQRGGNQTSFHSKSQSSSSRAYRPQKPHHPRASSARKRQAQHHGSSSTSSSSGSDSDEARFRRRKNRSMAKARSMCLPMNFDNEDVAKGSVIRDRARIGASLADVDPMNIDREVTFGSVGGHKNHIRALKEMIVFPLLYPEVFDRFKISPPRGVLFFGPPGCGKTLMARALANECSKGGKKVAFFMRKGADCLSKWVGESERQLRLLFDQAYQMRPSIIFFDEIDGLAPVRSSRQDQIHSSIVSTLLALMDGLDNRGEIVVIGATNRIDAIDPALRRPGRFDREFAFPLPSREDRLSILSIHTRLWQPQLKTTFLSELADSTVGYCGADLKALCTEAALFALRRKYPQIYNTTQKLVLDVSSISIQASDFFKGLKSIVPTAQRSDASSGRKLPETARPLLLEAFNSLLSQVGFIFPPAWKSVCKAAKEVQELLQIEKKLINDIKTNTESLHYRQPVICGLGEHSERPSVAQKRQRNSIISSRRQPLSSRGLEVSRTNHSSVHNWSGSIAVEKRTRSTGDIRTGLSKLGGDSAVGVLNSLDHLYRIKNPEDVYFDLNEMADDAMDSSSRSILVVDESESESQEQPARSMQIESSSESRSDTLSVHLSGSYLNLSSHPHAIPPVYRPRLILCGQGGMGQSSHLAPALLHALEDLQVQTLDLPALFAVSSKTPEEACTQIFREAKRLAPSVVYLPRISSWWDIVPGTFHATFLSILLSLPPDTPLFVLATAECPWSQLPEPLKELFRELNSEAFTVHPPSLEQRMRFFSNVLLKKPLQPPPLAPMTPAAVVLEELPVAPPPQPRELTSEELAKIDKQREAVLRELRIFLRDTTNKLLAERKFKEFVKPVDPEEVPDYYDIILEPMDLSTIMRKIDEHRYTTPKQWITDVNLITKNALEYNPEHDSESRLLRHRAVALQDMASSILDHELSEDFEKQCEEIAETYSRLGKDPSDSSPLKKSNSLPHFRQRNTTSQCSSTCDGSLKTELYNAPRRSLRQQGMQAEGGGFPYYSPTRQRQVKLERRVSTSNADSADDNLDVNIDVSMETESSQADEECDVNQEQRSRPKKSRSEPPKANNVGVDLRRSSLHSSTVRRQIIRPWEDKKEKNTSCLESPLPNGTAILGTELSSSSIQIQTEVTKLKNVNCTSGEINSLTTAAEALVEMGTGTPPKQDILIPPCDMDSTKKPTQQMNSSLSSSSVDDVSIDRGKLLSLFERVVTATGECSCEQMERLHATFDHLVFRYRMTTDRSELLKDLELATHLHLGNIPKKDL